MYISYDGILQKMIKKTLVLDKKKLVLDKKRLAAYQKYYRRFVAPKLTGDAWNSAGCVGGDYDTISEDTGGTRRPLMTCSRCINRFLIHFSLFFVDFRENQWKSRKSAKTMKINKNQ